MPKTPTLNIEVKASTKQLSSLIVKMDRFAKTAGTASTEFKNSSKSIKNSLSALDKATTASVKSIEKEMRQISVSMTRIADHSKKQLEKISKSGISATDKLGNAAVRNLNKIETAYKGMNAATAKAKTDIIAASKAIKSSAAQMGKDTANFGKKLSTALTTIENKLDDVLKGIQAMSRSAASAAKNATKAVQQHERALKNAGKTARAELTAQDRLYRKYSHSVQNLFLPQAYEQRTLSGLIAQRRSFNTLLKQTAVRGGMPGQYVSKGKYGKGEKMPQLPFGKIDDKALLAWGRGEQTVITKAMNNADMLRLKWGQLSIPLDALSRKLLETGRNMRWIGQNLFMTFTIPFLAGARKATQLYLSVAQEFTRIQKVAGLNINSKDAKKQAQDIKTFQRIKADIGTGVGRYGISQKSQAALFGDIVAMGYSADKAATSIRGMTTEAGQMADEIMRTATLGDIGIKTATDFYRTMLKVFVSAQPGVKTFSDTIQGTNFIVDQLNQIENKTSINLNQLADAMPVAAGAAKLFGLKAAELASTLTGLYDKGIAVNTAATGINFSLTRILAPTKKASVVFDQAFGAGALSKVQSIGGGMERLITLSAMYRQLLESQGKVKVTQVFSELVSKRQIKTFEPLVSSINEGTDQVRVALQAMPKAVEMASKKGIDIQNAPFYDLVPLMAKFKDELLKGANGAEGVTNGFIRSLIASNGWATTTTDNVKQLANELQKLSAREIDIKLKSDPIRYQILMQTIKMLGAEIGQFLFPMLIKVTTIVKKLVQSINNLAPSTKALLAGIAVALASFGPIAITIGSFRSVLGFVGKSIGFLLPKLKLMSVEALLLANNMGELNFATSTVVRIGPDMAAVIEDNQSKLSKLFMKMRGAKLLDISVTEAQVAAEQAHAAAIGETITAEQARERLQKKALPKALLSPERRTLFSRLFGTAPTGPSPTSGKSPIARRIMGMGGPRGVMPKGFTEVDDELRAISKRIQPEAIAQQLAIPVNQTAAGKTRGGLIGQLAQSLGITPAQTVDFPTEGALRPTREMMTAEQRAAEDAALKNVKASKRKRRRRRRTALPVSSIDQQEFQRRLVEVGRTGEALPTSDYIYKQQLLRNQQAAESLAAMRAKAIHPKQIAKLQEVEDAVRKGDYSQLESYIKRARGNKSALQGILTEAQAPISTITPVEAPSTLKQRLKQRLFGGGRSSSAAKALAKDIVSGGAISGPSIPLDAAAQGAIQKKVTKEIINKEFRKGSKIVAKQALGVAATPATVLGNIALSPLRALAFSKIDEVDTEGAVTGRRIRGGGKENLRFVRGFKKLKERSAAMRASAKKASDFVKDKGGIKAALLSPEMLTKKDQLFDGMKKGLSLVTKFGIYTPIILAIGAGIFLIAKNWDKVYESMAPGVKAIKEAWNKLWDSLKGVGKIFSDTFSSLAGESKSGEDAITSPFDAVGQVLSSVLEIVSSLVEAIAALINRLAPVFQWLANIMYNAFGFIINLIKAIAKLLKGDFSGAWGYAKLAIGFFLKYVLSITRPILFVFSTIAKIVLKTIGKILTAASYLPGIGKYAAKARDAINAMAEGFNLEKILSKQIDNVFMKDREITATAVAGETIYKPNKRATDNKQVKESDIPSDTDATDATDKAAKGMSNIWDNFLSTLKSKLDETINELKDTLNKAFAKVWEERLKVYDDQIKAIDDLEKKEEELLATQEYLQNRREALNKRSIDQQNYVRNRALAVYEGRIDDARMLDLEFSQTNAANNKAISDLDTSRARDLLKKERDIQRQRIQDAKAAAEAWMKVEEENFKKQIDLITQYTPRTDAEWRVMMDTINNTIANYGMPAITGSFMDGMAVFQKASDDAKNDLIASAFWSGEWIDTAVLGWISKMSGVPLQNLIKAAGDAGAAVGDAFDAGLENGTLTPEEATKLWNDTRNKNALAEQSQLFQQGQQTAQAQINAGGMSDLAAGFGGWGPSATAEDLQRNTLANGFSGWGPDPTRRANPPAPRSSGSGRPGGLQGLVIRAIEGGFNFIKSGDGGRLLSGIVATIQGYIGSSTEGWSGLFDGVFSSVFNSLGIDKTVTSFTDFWGRIIDGSISGVKSLFRTKISTPIADGIKSGIDTPKIKGDIADGITNVVKKGVKTSQGSLEIASPSKLSAREIGQPITLGIAAGLLNEKAVTILMNAFETLLRPLLNVERKGRLKIDFTIETGGIASGIKAKLDEILGRDIVFNTPKWMKDLQNVFKTLIAGVRAYVKYLDIGAGTPIGKAGPAQSSLEAYLGSSIPGFAKGGIVKRRRGGKIVRVGEGKHDEAIVPITSKNKKNIHSLMSPTGSASPTTSELQKNQINRYLKNHGISKKEFKNSSKKEQNTLTVKALAQPLVTALNKLMPKNRQVKLNIKKLGPEFADTFGYTQPYDGKYDNGFLMNARLTKKPRVVLNSRFLKFWKKDPYALAATIAHEFGHNLMTKYTNITPLDAVIAGQTRNANLIKLGLSDYARMLNLKDIQTTNTKFGPYSPYPKYEQYGEQYADDFAGGLGLPYKKARTFNQITALRSVLNRKGTSMLPNMLNERLLKLYGSPFLNAQMAAGGLVKKRSGGILANIGEGKYDEAVIPLPKGINQFLNSFQPSRTSMSSFEGSMKDSMTAALKECAPYMGGGEGSQGVNIYVDNFIGQPEWFESMMSEYGVKVAPNKQRAYGTMNRKVTSYQDNAYRTGKI